MMNGGSYEQKLTDYSDYDQDDDNGRHRSRSRDRDRERKHHRSSKKRRHHRKRSRSRSRTRSRERPSGRVHINPNFANLGPTASSLLETNNRLEADVVRLRNELSCTSIRIRALENELNNGAVVRGNLERDLSIARSNCQKLQQAASHTSLTLSSLRSDISATKKEKEELLETLKQSEMQLSANVEQVSFLTERNGVLGRKCEELVEKNGICRQERDDALQLVASLRREMERLQSEMDKRLLEQKRMEGDLCAVREKERMWKMEKMDLERKLLAKDSLLASEKKRMENERKRDRAQLTELEKKLKCEQPGWESQLGVEAVFRAIEAIKNEFVGQIQQLNEQMVPLKEKSCEVATHHLAARTSRPPRILSAPPMSDVHVSESSPNLCQDRSVHTLELIPVRSVELIPPPSPAPKAGDVDSFTEQELIGDTLDDTILSLNGPDLIEIDQIDAEALLND